MTAMFMCFSYFFFFKQKTAYEMRISDWSSDVCSSDLGGQVRGDREAQADVAGHRAARVEAGGVDADQLAGEVDQRAAGVARIDRGVGLDEVLEAHARHVAAADRRDDARGDRLADAEIGRA